MTRIITAIAMTCLLCSCIASNVVASQDREVALDPQRLVWRPAEAAAVPGLFESVQIAGAAAGSLWKVYYLFEVSGRYTAAALLAGKEGLSFKTVDGRWTLQDSNLILDAGEPAPLLTATDHLRLGETTDFLILRRVEVQ